MVLRLLIVRAEWLQFEGRPSAQQPSLEFLEPVQVLLLLVLLAGAAGGRAAAGGAVLGVPEACEAVLACWGAAGAAHTLLDGLQEAPERGRDEQRQQEQQQGAIYISNFGKKGIQTLRWNRARTTD
jgi:hypothetical protein